MQPHNSGVRCLALALGMAISLSASGMASAQAALIETPQLQIPHAQMARARMNGFDWLAKKTLVTKARFLVPETSVPQQVGTGSYICSPAGFGHRSRCYSN